MSIASPLIHEAGGQAGDYEFYDRLLADVNAAFPQRQGLSEEDFAVVATDQDVASTYIADVESGMHAIPQLAPVSSYPWLNTELYDSRYPDASEGADIRHFMDIPGVIPGPDVRDALGKLASNGGVVVFDYPSIDPEYPERVSRLVHESGGRITEAVQLGTQTYYAGRIRKVAGFDADSPVLSMQDGLRKMQSAGVIPNVLPSEGTTYLETIDPATADHLYEIYADAFSVLNDHPCRQGFTPEEFREVMVSESGKDIGKLLFMAGGEAANMVMFSHELPYPWLNPNAYKNLLSGNYPIDAATLASFEGGDMLYFPAIATNPKNRRGLDSQPVIDLLAQAVDASNNEVVVGFDCCDFNKDVLGLAAYIARLINNTGVASTSGFAEIGQQRYMGFNLATAD
ncbi:hypothetical protein EKI60_02950 [Candidatus Saccharibacteria bacterium]|nr:MAG: hypothetical protein EKI60_02950 [Candidatus Saccharibacteria bacterium]